MHLHQFQTGRMKKKVIFALLNTHTMAKKQQEETIVDVQEIYTKTEMYVDKNRKMLTAILGGIALAFCAFFGYQYLVVKPNELEARESIWKAEIYFQSDSLDLAMAGDGVYLGFEDVAAQYGNTSAGKLANYYMGIIHRDQGEYELAIENFKKCDFDDDVLGIIALGNIGDLYVELNDLESGLEWLNKAAAEAKGSASKSYSAPLYMLKAGIVQMELGNNSEAKKIFDAITEGYPDATEYEKAAKYGAMLYQY